MIPKSIKDWNEFSKKMMVVSSIFIIIGIVGGVRTAIFLKHAVPAVGTVVKLIDSRASDGHVVFKPVFTFQDSQNKEHEITSSSASYPPIGRVGDNISILYDPLDPDNAEENSFFNLWGVASIFGGLGLFFFAIFFGVAIFTR